MQQCAGLVSVQPDADEREFWRKAMQGAAKTFGIEQQVTVTEEGAREAITRWLRT